MKLMYILRVVVVAFGLFLTACGNDGGGTSTSPPPATYYPRFGFEANRGDGTLSVYLINASTGQWLHHGYAPTDPSPVAVAVSADEKFVYVANDSGTVTGFQLDTASGRLSFVENKTVGTNPSALAVAPNIPKFLFVANAGDDSIAGFTVNDTTGVLTATASSPTLLVPGAAPSALILHPANAWLYVANSGNGTVSGYKVDVTTGVLTPTSGSPYTVGTNPQGLTIDPSGQFLYVVNEGSDDVTSFAIAPLTSATPGALTSPNTIGAGDGPRSVAVAAGGAFAYVANYNAGTISSFSVNATTGALAPVGSALITVAAPRSLRADPSGKFLFVTSETGQVQQGYSVNTTNGALTAQSVTRTRTQPVALAISISTGSLSPQPRYAYAVDSTHASVRSHSVNSSTGALSFLNSYSSGNNPTAVTVEPFSRFVYTVNNTDNSLSGYSINDSTGALTRIDLNASPSSNDLPLVDIDPQHLVVDPSGRFLYVSLTTAAATGRVRAYNISSTGVLSEISGSPYNVGAEPKQLSIDPTGQYLFVANQTIAAGNGTVSAFSINPVTGQLSSLGAAVAAGSNPQSVAIEPSGRFAYVGNRGVANSGNSLTRYDIALNGTISSPGTTTTVTGPVDLALDPLGRFAYVAGAGLPGLALHEIASNDGTLTSAVTTSTSPTPASMEIDPSGRFAYVGYTDDLNISVYTINSSNGTLSAASTTGSADFPLSIAISRRLISSSSASGSWR